MKDDPIFIARRDAIKTEIEAAMTKKMDQHEKEGLKLNLRDDEKEAGDLSSDVKQYLKTDELNDASDEEEEQEEDGLDQSDGADEGNDDGMILRVGIFCAMGKSDSRCKTFCFGCLASFALKTRLESSRLLKHSQKLSILPNEAILTPRSWFAGRHRSVAMVEELARLPWPGWQVRVEHRDLSKKRGEGKRAGGRDKKSRGTRGGASSYFDEDHEQT